MKNDIFKYVEQRRPNRLASTGPMSVNILAG